MDKEVDSWCYMSFHAKSSGLAWIHTLVVQVEDLVPSITILHCFCSFQEKASLDLKSAQINFLQSPLAQNVKFYQIQISSIMR